MTSPADVIVIGGGVIGAALSWRLARDGVTITWLRAEPDRSATAASGAMLSVLSELSPWQEEASRDLEVATRGAGRIGWDSWLEELGEHAPTMVPGVQVIARTAADVQSLRIMRDDAARHGLVAETVDPRDIPGFRPDRSMAAVDALYLPGEATLDSARMLVTLEKAARREGASVLTTRVERIEVCESRVTAITAEGPVTARQVVVAAGAETTGLLRASDLDGLLPVVLGGRGVAVLVRATHPVPVCVRTPNRAFACGLHLVSREDGHTYIGATNRLATRMEPDSAAQLDEVLTLLGGATAELDVDLRRAEFVRASVGYRPLSLDRLPLVGRTKVESVLVATATWRNGVVLAPVVTDLVMDELSNPGSTRDHPFAPTRPLTHAALGPEALRRGAEGIVDAYLSSGSSGLSRSSELSAFLEAALAALVHGQDDRLARIVSRLLEQAPLEEVLPTVHDFMVRGRE
jgi:glycine oxidase